MRRIAPIFDQDDQGTVLRAQATPAIVNDPNTTPTSIKPKFIIYKYTLENWEDENKASHRRVAKESFGRQVQALYDECSKL